MSRGSLNVFVCLCHSTMLLLAFSASAQADAEGPVVINEIMYHVKETEWKEDPTAEFIELYHSGDQPISLEGWRFASGIRFTFPRRVMQPGDYLVVASDVEAFRGRYPTVEHVLGPFRGRLSNGGESIELEDADENVVDEVAYADSGRWAKLVSKRVNGYDDWVREAAHDGGGHSLSLISPAAKNEYGAHWKSSVAAGGTPGTKNDVFQDSVPPVVVSAIHGPLIPNSTEPVRVDVVVDHPVPVTLRLHYREDGESGFHSVPIVDGRGEIPPMPDKTVVQFYVHAEDAEGLASDYPDLQYEGGGLAKRQALCLYQVDDEFKMSEESAPGSKPTYRLISTAAEMALIRKLNKIAGMGNDFDHHLHGTFIVVDGVETQLRYHVSARLRGHGSRSQFPPGLRVSFPSDDPWRGVTDINLNSQYTHSQSLGAAIHQLVGFASARSTPIHLRLNGEDWTKKGSPQYGCYVHNEVFDSDYVEAHFPGEEEGNMYRLVANANLNDRGSDVSRYRTLYSKRNHASEDDYSDVLRLIKTLAADQPAETYFDRVNQVVDLEQWTRYLALDTLLGNTEGGLPTGRGDDVAMFMRRDGRFHLIPYDLDSILGMGERGRQINNSIFRYGNMQGFRHLFQDAEFLQLYSKQIVDLTETVYRPAIINRLIDDAWQGWIPPQEIARVKEFLEKRIAVVLSQIQSTTVIGSTLEMENGFHKASSEKFALYGRYDRGKVQDVLVGGTRPKLFSSTGMWIMPPDRMADLVRPGMNQIPIIMRDAAGNVVQEEVMRVWLDNGEVERVRGALAAGETIRWTSDSGPYLLETEVTVPSDSTLIIESGATVYGSAEGKLVVEGQLQIKGTSEKRVTFAKDPSNRDAKGWGGIRLAGSGTNLLGQTDFFDLHGPIEMEGGRTQIEGAHLQFVGGHGMTAQGASLTVSECELSQAEGLDVPAVEVRGGSLELRRTSIDRLGGGPAVSVIGVDDYYLFGNLLEQGTAPVIVERDQSGGFIDGNDFSVTSKSTVPVLAVGDGSVITRNRVFGQASLGPAASSNGNQHHQRVQEERVLAVAETRFVKEPPAKTSDRMRALRVEGAGLKAFRYQLDDEAWSEAISLGDEKTAGFTVEVSPGKHRLRIVGQHVSGRWQAEEAATESREFEMIEGLPSVVISEVLAINESSVYQREGERPDFIELHNYGNRPFDLSGFGLSDDPEEPHAFEFARGRTLEPGGYLVLPADRDSMGFALSGDGDRVLLSDAEGNAVDQIEFGLQIADHSISRLEDGTWVLSEPTPGAENEPMALAEASSALEFSEWLAVASVNAPDEFLEVCNTADQPVAMGGFVITDRVPNSRAWRALPPLTFIDAGARQVFFTDGDPEKGSDHLDFRLAKEGEVIGLFDDTHAMVDFVVYGPQKPGVSQGRAEDDALYYGQPSPGLETAGLADEASVKLMNGIRIAEIHYHPSSNEDEEFIELINVSDEQLDLGGLEFISGIEFTFEGAGLAPGARVVVVKDRRAFQRRYGSTASIAGEYDGKLSNGGELLSLVTRDGDTVVEFTYSDRWHRPTDGRGYSLVVADPKSSRVDAKKAWKVSEEIGGTPGK